MVGKAKGDNRAGVECDAPAIPTAALAGAPRAKSYFILPVGMGMSELKMSH